MSRGHAGRCLWRLERGRSQGRDPTRVFETGCLAHARRKFFEFADVEGAARKRSRGQRSSMINPIALAAVNRIDALFDLERIINTKTSAERFTVR